MTNNNQNSLTFDWTLHSIFLRRKKEGGKQGFSILFNEMVFFQCLQIILAIWRFSVGYFFQFIQSFYSYFPLLKRFVDQVRIFCLTRIKPLFTTGGLSSKIMVTPFNCLNMTPTDVRMQHHKCYKRIIEIETNARLSHKSERENIEITHH